MRTIKACVKVAAGGVLAALAMLGLLMAPGFLSDRDSTVAQHSGQEARR